MNFNGNFKKLGSVDITKLKQKVTSISDETWLGDKSRQEVFEVHKHTQTISLIFDEDYRHTNPTIHPEYEEYREVIEPIMTIISEQFNNTLKAKRLRKKNGPGYFIRTILVRLLPHSEITPHQDNGESLSKCHRIHIPVITSDKTSFNVGDESRNMNEGEIWEINNRHIHSVKNEGEQPRTHLIMDYVLPGEHIKDINGKVIV